MEVTINNNPIAVPLQCSTWAHFLEWLETEYLQAGQCITSISIEGHEDLDYRRPDLCSRNLLFVGKVGVEFGDFDQVVREALAELEEEIARIIGAVGEIAVLLDNRDEEKAYTLLAELLENIKVLFSIMIEDLGWVDPDGSQLSHREIPTRLEGALIQLISAQERRFCLLICDILEYEIGPILECWKQIVEATRTGLNPELASVSR